MREEHGSGGQKYHRADCRGEETASTQYPRRSFLAATAAVGSATMLASWSNVQAADSAVDTSPVDRSKSIIGLYGPWAAGLAEDPPRLSFRRDEFADLESWRRRAVAKARECIAAPDLGGVPQVTIDRTFEYDGLHIEELHWQLPYGRPTRAVLLKPRGAKGRLPGILGLHDHGGMKYFGKRKIIRTSDRVHPLIEDHQRDDYGGRAWANEIAKRGYVVLVHDTFTFGSRRVLYQDMAEIPWGEASTRGKSDDDPENPDHIKTYNRWAAAHEHIMAKSLFCAGTTWPGVFLAEDKVALSVLAQRSDVDSDRLGCAGLSGGGLRTVYLGGLDPRIRCAVCVGFMSTWNDFLLHKSYTHTWMTYTPLLPQFLDFPEILGLRVPNPTMVLSNNDDPLYTLPEMHRADRILREIFAKAKEPERYVGRFYPGPHKFDRTMQRDAFAWFDRWLK